MKGDGKLCQTEVREAANADFLFTFLLRCRTLLHAPSVSGFINRNKMSTKIYIGIFFLFLSIGEVMFAPVCLLSVCLSYKHMDGCHEMWWR